MAENMDSMSRADLEARARELGVENPESFQNKGELLAAIKSRQTNGGMLVNPFGGNDEDGDDGDDEGQGESGLDPALNPLNLDVNVSGDLQPSTGSAASPFANQVTPDPEMAKKLAELEAQIAELQGQLLDPVTNQRASDFLPSNPNLDERSQALLLGARRASGVGARAATLNKAMATRANQEAAMERNYEAMEMVERDNPLPSQETVVIDPATYRARMSARVAAEAKILGTNRTIPGGLFIVNGETVNANGDLIDEDGNILQKRSA